MTTTSQTSFLDRPTGDERIPERALGYVTEAAREEMFDMIATACVEAGVMRSQIAKRLGKDPAVVTRQLSAPGNWTIDTISEYLFAINGRLVRASSYCPVEQAVANNRHANCLDEPYSELKVIQITKTHRKPNTRTRAIAAAAPWK